MDFSYNNVVPSFRLDGRVAIITGGSGGLASVISRALLAQGAEIALIDMNLERTTQAAKDVVQWGEEELKGASFPIGQVTAWSCNIGDYPSVEETFAAINEKHGKIADLLINTAGYCENFPAEEYPAQNAEGIMKVNGLGAFYVSQAFAKPLIQNNLGGSVILIGSMSGTIVNDPQPQCMYNMSKAGVIHLARSLACEWAKYNIRVNTLSPGYILTPLTRNVISGHTEMKEAWESKIPMKRMAEPKEFVGSILYLASDSASSYTTGHNLVADGGYECW
ncbi:NAD(P)-dependent dehydrogenase [Yamadazyma tenuis]|uniref:D-arabinitol 2-dehydrogenase [ribulose-forming] n=1 Tax=Candida tenuis (strain ATCC 10573 / BCRC 21748 / CBS 615 / JCM 9827 / NBRC 10315 / NRRL Y-1498 / VKM Y-70) TaxID=590646 RepID=G3B1Z0_CANTC|nr:D-arabinitol 2-dehydrogenase [Yamadazyma tenuis ATCC 10573]EGV64564.1 D-arabinitol 2-dehydrogenase [Yamadazyma tenuis ATCC 10573]WEJ97331.1 NAD(P)-dependent dehydrogenase [Yamadazyma tenuis]